MARAICSAAALALAAGCLGGRKAHPERGEARAGEGGARGERAEGGHAAGREEGRRGQAVEGRATRVPAEPGALLGADAVRQLQSALAERHLLSGHQAGALDGPTRAAVRRFQAQQGLAETGIPDRETLRELGVAADASYGSGQGR